MDVSNFRAGHIYFWLRYTYYNILKYLRMTYKYIYYYCYGGHWTRWVVFVFTNRYKTYREKNYRLGGTCQQEFFPKFPNKCYWHGTRARRYNMQYIHFLVCIVTFYSNGRVICHTSQGDVLLMLFSKKCRFSGPSINWIYTVLEV